MLVVALGAGASASFRMLAHAPTAAAEEPPSPAVEFDTGQESGWLPSGEDDSLSLNLPAAEEGSQNGDPETEQHQPGFLPAQPGEGAQRVTGQGDAWVPPLGSDDLEPQSGLSQSQSNPVGSPPREPARGNAPPPVPGFSDVPPLAVGEPAGPAVGPPPVPPPAKPGSSWNPLRWFSSEKTQPQSAQPPAEPPPPGEQALAELSLREAATSGERPSPEVTPESLIPIARAAAANATTQAREHADSAATSTDPVEQSMAGVSDDLAEAARNLAEVVEHAASLAKYDNVSAQHDDRSDVSMIARIADTGRWGAGQAESGTRSSQRQSPWQVVVSATLSSEDASKAAIWASELDVEGLPESTRQDVLRLVQRSVNATQRGARAARNAATAQPTALAEVFAQRAEKARDNAIAAAAKAQQTLGSHPPEPQP